jgi:phosphate transport system protein
MSLFLQRDLEGLNRALLRMAAMAEEAVRKAVQALLERNAELAQEVIRGDAVVDEEENRLNEQCLKVLALHQPVASDLRRVTAVMAVATDLERIADLAEDIADRAVHLAGLPAAPLSAALPAMADKALAMVRASLAAFAALDVRQARAVCRSDAEVNRLNDEVIQELIDAMKQTPERVESGLSLFSVVRHLERVADHATNIAEDVVYLAEGSIIRHHPEALAD